MSLEDIIVSPDEMKTKKDAKVMPFQKYFDAVERIGMIKWIKETMQKRPDKMIIVKVSDVSKEMGPSFEASHFTTLYTGLKYVLFQNGITLALALHKDGERVFIMKEKKPGDELPLSYRRIEERAARKEKREKYFEELRVKYEKEKMEKMEIKKEKDSIYEEFIREKDRMEDEFRRERKAMQETIRKLREEIGKRKEKRNYIVEVFKMNWKTLEWKLIRQKMIKTEDTLLDTIREFSSKSPDERFRIEVTEVIDIGEEERKGEREIEVIEIPEKQENVENVVGIVSKGVEG